jgi:hypothetical protein
MKIGKICLNAGFHSFAVLTLPKQLFRKYLCFLFGPLQLGSKKSILR